MPLYPTWQEIAVRLGITMLAGVIIGFNRGLHGHAAGLRTTILVGLAASVSMIQANILLPVHGKTTESFAVMDLMRLPLGTVQDFLNLIASFGCKAQFQRQEQLEQKDEPNLSFEIRWKQLEADGPPYELLNVLNARGQVVSFDFASSRD